MTTSLVLGLAPPQSPDSPFFWLPVRGSTSAEHVDLLFTALLVIALISTLGVVTAMVYFVMRYRAGTRSKHVVTGGSDHNTLLELAWSVIPFIVVMTLFAYGFKGYIDLRTAPKDSLEIYVTGQKWKWLFRYPTGLTDDTLHVPVDTSVRLILQSEDVIHSLYIPTFRVKMDAVPGRYTDLWFRATETGEFPVLCAEYCGTSHSDMVTAVVVHKPGGYEKWLESREKELMQKPPAELGALLYAKQGCTTCHSVDGTPLVGPSLKALWGKDEAMTGGATVKVDENYLRESILDPQAKIVQGYQPAMPTYKGKLSDQELTGLIEFIKTLK